MRRELSQMSIEELWQLFPIVLTGHQSYWEQWYLDEEAVLKNMMKSKQSLPKKSNR
ncbi:MAG: hypothetical protein PHN26_04795 [Eubacteriaceae bacterium]|nr:hypothetical protein [Eubacteriaceae bacterium]